MDKKRNIFDEIPPGAVLRPTDQDILTAAIEEFGHRLFGGTDYIYQQTRSLTTWSVGALIEAMGHGYIELYRVCEGVWHCAYRLKIGQRLIEQAPTPLQALTAARVEMLRSEGE